MSKKDFDKFLNQQIKNTQDDPWVDWEVERVEWLNYLNHFYEIIESFLDEYVKSKKLTFEESTKDIFEEYIGTYSVKVLDIKLGMHKVRLEPIGTHLVGAKGRVDLMGVNGKVKFVLVNKNSSRPSKIKISIRAEGEEIAQERDESQSIEWVWKIATPPPNIEYFDLDKEVFLDTLLEVVGA